MGNSQEPRVIASPGEQSKDRSRLILTRLVHGELPVGS
jgi:hypothetical protein